MKYLNLCIEAMKEVVELGKTLEMREYFRDESQKGESIHTCNTPACVAGYASLKAGLAPATLWMIVVCEIGADWADSAFNGMEDNRRINAPEKLKDHPHVNKEYPTAEEALDYLLKLKEHLEKRIKK